MKYHIGQQPTQFGTIKTFKPCLRPSRGGLSEERIAKVKDMLNNPMNWNEVRLGRKYTIPTPTRSKKWGG